MDVRRGLGTFFLGLYIVLETVFFLAKGLLICLVVLPARWVRRACRRWPDAAKVVAFLAIGVLLIKGAFAVGGNPAWVSTPLAAVGVLAVAYSLGKLVSGLIGTEMNPLED